MERGILDGVERLARQTPTAQLILWQDGKIRLDIEMVETPVDVYAVQKGLVSLLFAIAEEKYLLDIPDCVNHHLPPEWTNLNPWDEAKLTIEGVLNMVTGMDDDLNALGTIDETWRYNNVAYNYLKKILEAHTELSLQEVTRQWLLEPLGMTRTEWQQRDALLPDGTPFTGLESTARDLLELVKLVLENGRDLVPAHYIESLNEPGPAENPAWNRCWWNNHSDFFRLPFREEKVIKGPIMQGLPSDALAARGAHYNLLLVVPSQQMILARTALPVEAGANPPQFERALWEILGSG